MGKALLVVCMLAGVASAQSAGRTRLQLVDGRVVDGQLTGGDAASYYIQTPQGYFSIARVQVVAVTPMQQLGAPPPAPMPQMPMSSPEDGSPKTRRAASVTVAAGTYLLTAGIAFSRMKEDDDASYGLIPLAGPLLWATKNDSDDFMEDGWDWLALGSSAIQAAGILGMFSSKRVSDHSLVQVTPVGAPRYGGIAVAGQW